MYILKQAGGIASAHIEYYKLFFLDMDSFVTHLLLVRTVVVQIWVWSILDSGKTVVVLFVSGNSSALDYEGSFPTNWHTRIDQVFMLGTHSNNSCFH